MPDCQMPMADWAGRDAAFLRQFTRHGTAIELGPSHVSTGRPRCPRPTNLSLAAPETSIPTPQCYP